MELFSLGRYETKHWGGQIGAMPVDWQRIDNLPGSYLHQIGQVAVDSGSVGAQIQIGDLITEVRVETPSGDGAYVVLAGKIEGVGKCLIVAFDLEQGDEYIG